MFYLVKVYVYSFSLSMLIILWLYKEIYIPFLESFLRNVKWFDELAARLLWCRYNVFFLFFGLGQAYHMSLINSSRVSGVGKEYVFIIFICYVVFY